MISETRLTDWINKTGCGRGISSPVFYAGVQMCTLHMFVKKLFRLRIWSPRYKYENIFNTQHPKPSTPENVNVKTVKTTTVTDVRIGVMNVQSLGNKLDCVIDHITDNRIDIVGITETWLSNDDKNKMSVVNTCLNNGYTLLHRPRNTGRRGGGVGVLINNQINVKSRMIGVNPEITSFESMEVVITAGSITIRLSVIYRMPPVKSKNGNKVHFATNSRLSRETVMYEW